MRKTVSAMEARRRLGELLEGVYYRNDYVMIARNGKPMAALVPASRLHELDRIAQEARESFDELRNRTIKLPEAEAMKLAVELVKGDRRKQRTKSKRTA
jgi:prevent-host-death family protein